MVGKQQEGASTAAFFWVDFMRWRQSRATHVEVTDVSDIRVRQGSDHEPLWRRSSRRGMHWIVGVPWVSTREAFKTFQRYWRLGVV